MSALLLVQTLSFFPQLPAPPQLLGRVHPIVLIVTTMIMLDLLQQLLIVKKGRPRKARYFAYAAPLVLVFIILRLAEAHETPIGRGLTLVDARGVTLTLNLVSLGGFLLLSFLPLLGRLHRTGPWISLAIFTTIIAFSLSKISHDILGNSPDFLLLSKSSTTEALLFIGLASLSIPLTKARNLLIDPATPKINLVLFLSLFVLSLHLLTNVYRRVWTPYDITIFVAISGLIVFVAERYLRPLEKLNQSPHSPLEITPSPSRPMGHLKHSIDGFWGPTTQFDASDRGRAPRGLRLHHWATFHASLKQRSLMAGLFLFAVTLLFQTLFSQIAPGLPVIWTGTAIWAYLLILHNDHGKKTMLVTGGLALILSSLVLGTAWSSALLSTLGMGLSAFFISELAVKLLTLTLRGRQVRHMRTTPQAVIGFLLSSLFVNAFFALITQNLIAAVTDGPSAFDFQHLWLSNVAGLSLLTPLLFGLIWKLHFGLSRSDEPVIPALPLILMLCGLAFIVGRLPFEDYGFSATFPIIMGMMLLLVTLILPSMLAISLANIITSVTLLTGAALNSSQTYSEALVLVLLASNLITVAGIYKHQHSRDRLLRNEVLENSPAMLVTMDAQFRITTASERFCAYIGAPREEIIGNTPSTAGFLRLPESTLQNMRQFIRETPAVDFTLEIDIRLRDGTLGKALAAIHKSIAPNVPYHYLIQITDTTELNRNSRLYKLTLEEGPALLMVQDANRKTLDIAPALCNLLGYTRAELIGQDLAQLTSCRTRKFIDETRVLGDSVNPFPNKVLEFTTKSGKLRKMTAERQIIDPIAHGEQPKYITLFTDVTELEAQRSLTETLLNRNAAIVLSQDRNWRIQSASDAWSSHFGYSREETLGRDLLDFLPELDRAKSKSFRRHVLSQVKDKETISNTLTLLTKSGERRIVELRSVIEHTEEQWLNIIMVVDITEVSLARQKLEHLVAHDELTGLLSRRGFNTQHADGKRLRDYDLFLIDVDHFKSVNDAYGHEVGDELLRKISKVLKDMAKPLGSASRIGGEEFALLRPATRHEANQQFAEELIREIAATVLHTPSGPVSRTISVGLTRLNRTDRLETAVKWADWALRDAKENGRNTVVVADERFSEKLRRQGKLTSHQDIVQALEKNEIKKYVQPIFDAAQRRVVGFEALMRWERKDGQVVSPRQFLPQLQNVLLSADYADVPQQMRATLLSNLTACPGAFVSFNTRLEALAFPGAALKLLRSFGALKLHRHDIVIEICEDAITDRIDMDQAMMEIAILRGHGIRIALDDFGKEASNLNRLTNLPIDIVKIDKSLIDRIVTDRRSREALRSIIHLAEALEFEIIAEGVEMPAQRDMLLSLGLTLHQGFLHARPMPVSEANRLYAQRISDVMLVDT